MAQGTEADEPATLGAIAWLFLKLGTIAFGGPAAHIALMEDEVVRRRRWLSRDKFLDLLAATNLIPGPNSTEMAIHIGALKRGAAGLVVAGACFILPAALLVGVIAWAYVEYRTLPQVEGILYGVKPVLIAVVAQALWRLTRDAVKSPLLAAVALAAVVAAAFGADELAILGAAGAFVAAVRYAQLRREPGSPAAGALLLAIPLGQAAAAAVPVSLGGVFLFFVKVGSVLFGSGYVLLAFLRSDLVERWGWLTEQQLLDAVAVGQVTPGPVFTTATFIGYVLAGPEGAVLATVGIFLPAFLFVALSAPLVPRIRRSPVAGAFLDGVVAGSLALMAVVTWHLGRAAVIDGFTAALALLSGALLLIWRVNSTWLVLGGAALGAALTAIGWGA